MSDVQKTTYTLSVEYENVNIEGYPKHYLTVQSFDGTDVHINVVLDQVATFLKAAGYVFNHLEAV